MNYSNESEIMVSVVMITYNHENYIAQAIEGVLIQRTDFKIELIIHNDASTDNTEAIIREYEKKNPELFVTINQTENQYSKKEKHIWLDITFPIARGKYIAICDGDDYWTDPLKLQKQVNFLEANPEYGLTFTKANIFVQKKGKFIVYTGGRKEKFEDLLSGNSVVASTTCFRKYLLDQYLSEVNTASKGWKMGDYPIWLYLAIKSKIKLDTTVTGVYRMLESSASHFRDLSHNVGFLLSAYDISIFYLQKYAPNNKILLHSVIENYMWKLFSYWCRSDAPEIKNKIEYELKKTDQRKSIKSSLIKVTFRVPIFRYLFKFYFKIRNEIALTQRNYFNRQLLYD